MATEHINALDQAPDLRVLAHATDDECVTQTSISSEGRELLMDLQRQFPRGREH